MKKVFLDLIRARCIKCSWFLYKGKIEKCDAKNCIFYPYRKDGEEVKGATEAKLKTAIHRYCKDCSGSGFKKECMEEECVLYPFSVKGGVD